MTTIISIEVFINVARAELFADNHLLYQDVTLYA
jgi:hypothetical protein